ncbi:beta-N-acetylhexosaminidase [Kitasatospora sp. NPDC052868]|uniref:beta-N-acetylhexosaminidase n=1 Tax=Kitasatospora sp. NPDC052868 TaxID=3364060 RepID=UPI0037CC8FDF
MPIRPAGRSARTSRLLIIAVVLVLAAGFGLHRALGGGEEDGGHPRFVDRTGPRTGARIIPAPLSATAGTGPSFELSAQTAVRIGATGTAEQRAEIRRTAEQLAEALRRPTGFPIAVTDAVTSAEPGAEPGGPAGGIVLALDPALPEETGPEGYRLTAGGATARITARTPAGLYRGTQTLRQLLPPQIESRTPVAAPVSWQAAAVDITDRPRYAYRGAMLDVARHFFTADEVKGFIDRLALYKVNHLHLHLSDDQGWRIAVPGRPELTSVGATSEVGGTPGGFYTEADYREIVRYAQEHYLTVVPELDLPGHSNAILAAYPELDCNDSARPWPYTGIEVGFSLLCAKDERTYALTADVINEVARLTPGPYLHLGGDEVRKLAPEDYRAFVRRVSAQVVAAGKIPVGWNQTASAAGPGGVGLLQYWDGKGTRDQDLKDAVGRGAQVIMSPAGRTYLDMKYEASYPLGLSWAGTVDVWSTYSWDPDTLVALSPGAVLGVEAPLWTETLSTPAELDRMLLPRLPAIAELGWSDRSAHDWPRFRQRLAEEGARWEAAGFGYEKRSEVPWPGPGH